MLQVRKNAAFTLIELLVVVIIVAVLAAVGVPLLSANVTRAKASEAEAGLGAIRTQLRAKKAELGVYPSLTGTLNSGTPPDTVAEQLGLALDDLDGRYFVTSDYSITSTDGTTYCIEVTGSSGPGTDAGSQTVIRSMDQNGTISNASC